MRHIIINGENIINFEDIYYYGEKLNNNCGDKLIYCHIKLYLGVCLKKKKSHTYDIKGES